MNTLEESPHLDSDQNEDFNHILFHNPIIGTVLLSQEGTFLETNYRFLQIIGYTQDELAHKKWADLVGIDPFFEECYCSQSKHDSEVQPIHQDTIRMCHYQEHECYLSSKQQHMVLCKIYAKSIIYQTEPAVLFLIENISAENIYRQMFQINPAAKLLIDPETGMIIDANLAASIFYGYTASQLKQMTVYDLCVLPKETIVYHIQSTIQAQSFTFESKHCKANGTHCDVEVSNARIRVGTKEYLYSIVRDVTEQNRVTQALHQEVQRNDTLLNTMTEGFHVIDPKGRILEVNRAFCDLTGYSREELLKLFIHDIDNFFKPTTCLLEKLDQLAQEENTTFETILKRKDQSNIYVEIKTRRFFSGTEELIFCSARDISERKKAEQALRESEACLREITETIAEGLYVLNEHGHIIFSNPETSRLLGWSQEALYEQDAHELFHYATPDGKLLNKQLCPIFIAIQQGKIYRGVEYFWHSHGFSIPVSIVATPVIRAEKIVGSIVTFQDLRELKAAEQQRHDTEVRFQKISDALPGVVYQLLYDQKTQKFSFLFLSAGARDLFDLAPECMLEEFVFEEALLMVLKEDKLQVSEATTHSRQLLQPWDVEFRIYTQKGQLKWIHGHSMPEKNAKGNIIWNGFLVDITEHKKEEEAIWLEREKFKLAIEASEAGYYDHDLQFKNTHVDTRCATIFGYLPEEIPHGPPVTQWWLDRIFPEYQEMILCEYNRLLQKSIDHLVLEYKIKHRSGASRWLRVTSKRIDFENNILHPYDEIVGIVLDITSIRQSQEKLEILANYDQLTHLGNRHAFTHQLPQWGERAHREHQTFALLFLDLDGFKLINDHYGHDIGDLLLKEVAKRLNLCLTHPKDIAYRVGGDEFILLIWHQPQFTQYLTELANRVIQNLGVVFTIGIEEMHIGVSIGIAIYPHDTMDIHNLIKCADSAMYEAKNNGKNTYRFYGTFLE